MGKEFTDPAINDLSVFILHKVTFGKTGLEVSRLCVGTDYRDFYGNADLGSALLMRAYELGVNFWDTADDYGAHPAIREALRSLDRSRIVIATKTYGKERSDVLESIERSLQEMETPYIDVFMLHAVDTVQEFRNRSQALRAIIEAKEKGLIRAVGLSTHSAQMTWTLAEIPEIEVVLTVLNKAGLRMSGSLNEMERATRRIYEAGKAVYLMKALARGKLADNVESALNYVYKLPYVHSVSIGMKSLNELETNARIVNEFLSKNIS